jgi:DNA-binding NarL/FixJ family response regulator
MTAASEPNAPVGLLLSDDMIFTSRITGIARDQHMLIKSARSSDGLLTLASHQTPRCVIIDLANFGLNIENLIAGLRAACTPIPRLVAYGSHVDTETLKAARAAGCDVVLPRSQFVAELPRALREWMAEPS